MKKYEVKRQLEIETKDGIKLSFSSGIEYPVESLLKFLGQSEIDMNFDEVIEKDYFSYYLQEAIENNRIDLKIDQCKLLLKAPAQTNYKKFILNCILEQIQKDLEGKNPNWNNEYKEKILYLL